MIVGKKKIEPGRYVITMDGKASPLEIVKGVPPRFGMPQMWEVHSGKTFLFEAIGLSGCMFAILTILIAHEDDQ